MPYVPEHIRDELSHRKPLSAGELTYLLTEQIMDYGPSVGDRNFADHAEVMAALECAKLEYARRWLYPFEDEKLKLNGDIEWV